MHAAPGRQATAAVRRRVCVAALLESVRLVVLSACREDLGASNGRVAAASSRARARAQVEPPASDSTRTSGHSARGKGCTHIAPPRRRWACDAGDTVGDDDGRDSLVSRQLPNSCLSHVPGSCREPGEIQSFQEVAEPLLESCSLSLCGPGSHFGSSNRLTLQTTGGLAPSGGWFEAVLPLPFGDATARVQRHGPWRWSARARSFRRENSPAGSRACRLQARQWRRCRVAPHKGFGEYWRRCRATGHSVSPAPGPVQTVPPFWALPLWVRRQLQQPRDQLGVWARDRRCNGWGGCCPAPPRACDVRRRRRRPLSGASRRWTTSKRRRD